MSILTGREEAKLTDNSLKAEVKVEVKKEKKTPKKK